MDSKNFETDILHIDYPQPDPYHSLAMPVYHVAAYEFDTAEEMEEAFCGRTNDNIYSRIGNPTVQYFEDRIKTVTGALSVTALNSGMAAISNTFITLASTGSNIVTSPHLFGNTYSFFINTLAAFGVEPRFCNLTNPEEVKKQIDKNTCALFLEIITNPQMEVADLKMLAQIAHENGIPLIADTTIVPFNVFKAKNFGVDIEIISSTKYISGGATSLGGLIIDYGQFDWSHTPKLKALCGDNPHATFTAKLRKEIHRNLGAYMTPHVAYMQTLGLETLEVHFQRQATSCLELAKRLSQSDKIISVNYTGLENNPFYNISCKQFGELPGAMFTFDLESWEACFNFINRLKL
ncbi:MAG: PLP-dependent transferase, partial [Odoribacter sp.]|nr:PLP-dependent transferase [Odoribacter sp.]